MPKTIKNKFYECLSISKLYSAYVRARKNKRFKEEIIKFELNLENNLVNLYNSIKNNTYKVGKYTRFKVYEPKEREIQSLPFKDRIVHQWYVYEFVLPYILPKLINTTYACIPNRGTHKSTEKLQKYLRKAKKIIQIVIF